MTHRVIRAEQVDRAGIITLNCPEVLNALNVQMFRELDQDIVANEGDGGVGAIAYRNQGHPGQMIEHLSCFL